MTSSGHAHRELELHEPNSSSPLVITSSRVQCNAALIPQICIKNSSFITCESDTSKGRGHDRLPN